MLTAQDMPSKPVKKTYTPKERVQQSWNSTDFNYSSASWIKLRNYARKLHPLCAECVKYDILTPTKIIDHIKPISKGGEPYDINNLQGLCESCHNSKTRKQQ